MNHWWSALAKRFGNSRLHVVFLSLLASILIVPSALAGYVIKAPVNNLQFSSPPSIVLNKAVGQPGVDYELYLNNQNIASMANLNSTGKNYLVLGSAIAGLVVSDTNEVRVVRENPILPGGAPVVETETFRYTGTVTGPGDGGSAGGDTGGGNTGGDSGSGDGDTGGGGSGSGSGGGDSGSGGDSGNGSGSGTSGDPTVVPAGFAIKSPTRTVTYSSLPSFILSRTAGAPGVDYFVSLNGTSIDQFAALNSTGNNYLVTGADIENLLNEGANELTALRENTLISGQYLLERVVFNYGEAPDTGGGTGDGGNGSGSGSDGGDGTGFVGNIVLSPRNNTSITNTPSIVLAKGAGVPGQGYQLYLNGRSVDEFASLNATGSNYLITGNDISDLIRQGANQISAVRPKSDTGGLQIDTQLVNFTVDAGGPVMRVEEVSLVGGNSLEVRGKVTDPAGISGVWLNDQSMTVATNGQFSGVIPTAARYELRSEDLNGDLSVERFSPQVNRIPHAVTANISSEGLGPVGELISEMVVENRSSLVAYVLARNPLYQGKPGGLAGDVTLDATGLTFDDPLVGLVSNAGILQLSGQIPNVVVPLAGKSKQCILICFDIPITGTVYINLAGMVADVDLFVSPQGQISLDLQDFQTQLGEYRFESNWDGVPIISGIIQNAVDKVLADALTAALEVPLEQTLNLAFSGLNTSIAGTVLDVPFVLEAIPETLVPDQTGLVLTAGVEIATDVQTGAMNLGYPVTEVQAPVLPAGQPFEAALSVDLLNQLVWQGQQAGMIDLQLCGVLGNLVDALDVDPDLLTILPPETQSLFDEGGFRLTTRALESPVLNIPGAGNALAGLEVDSLRASLRMDALNLPSQGVLPFGPGVQALELEGIVTLSARANILVKPGNRLGIDVDGVPLITLDLDKATEYDANGNVVSVKTEAEDLEGLTSFYNLLFTLIMPTAIPVIEASLGEVPVPTLAGFSLGLDTLQVSEDHIVSINGTLARDGAGDQSLDIPFPAALGQFRGSCQ